MLTVSNYHYIRRSFSSPYPSIFGITPCEFENQLTLLKDKGDFISPNEFLNHSKEILNSKENYHLITFDDGLREQFELAFPILEDKGISALFFLNSINYKSKRMSTVHKIHLIRSVCSPLFLLEKINKIYNESCSKVYKNKAVQTYIYDDKVNAELKYYLNFVIPLKTRELIVDEIFYELFDEKEQVEKLYMDFKHISNLSEKKCLGNHTHSHYPLGILSKSEMKYELLESKKYFESITNSKVNFVSYPYGTDESCTQEVCDLAKITGHKVGFTTKRIINTGAVDLLSLGRFDCNDLIGGKNYKI